MWLKSFVKIIFIIASVAAGSLSEYDECIRFEGESGFFTLKERTPIKDRSTISMEVKAYNCHGISLTFWNADDYSLTVKNFYFPTHGPISKFNVFDACNGLWHNVTFEVTEQAPLFLDGRMVDTSFDFQLNAFIDAFKNHELNVKIDANNLGPRDESFESFVRNIRIDKQLQQRVNVLNGTIGIRDCPKDVRIGVNGGSVLLNKTFNINDDFRAYFDLQVPDSSAKCSALLLSAQNGDDHLVVEYYDDDLYMKIKSGNVTDEVKVSFRFGNFDICDGNWHKVAVLKGGTDVKAIVDGTSSSANYVATFNFTAPLYIGQNPELRADSSVQSPKSFTGCFRTLNINGIFPEINENGFDGDVQLNYCSA